MAKKRSVSPTLGTSSRLANDTYYVFIPPDVDRDQYIQHCYRTDQVSVRNLDGDVIHRCLVAKGIMQDIVFPEGSGIELGSMVLGATSKRQGATFITAVFPEPDKNQFLEEGIKEISNSSALIQLDEENNTTTITQEGDNAQINITSSNNNKDSEVNIESSGKLNTSSLSNFNEVEEEYTLNVKKPNTDDNITLIKAKRDSFVISLSKNDEPQIDLILNQDGFQYTDKNQNQIIVSGNDIKLNGKQSVTFGNGDEPILLGKKTIDLLQDFIKEVATSFAGPYPLSNAANMSLLIPELQTLLSKYSTTD